MKIYEVDNVPVFSVKLAKALLAKGYKIVDVKDNYKFAGEVVFYFEPQEGLEKYIDSWKTTKDLYDN